MMQQSVKEWKVYPAGEQKVVHVPNGWGEGLRSHLESHGVQARVSPAAETPFERLEIEGNVDPAVLQAIIDAWPR